MALPSSGSLNFVGIQQEFGGSNPIGINEYYAADPLRVPSSGTIAADDFYSASVRTTKIVVRNNNDSYNRKGFAVANGYFHYVAETGQSGSAFGSSTRTTGLASSRTLACIVRNEFTYPNIFIGFSGSSASTQGGFSQVDFYPTTGPQGGPFYANLNSGYTLYRSDVQGFHQLSGTSPTVYAYRWSTYPGQQGNSDVSDVSTLLNNTSGPAAEVYVEFS